MNIDKKTYPLLLDKIEKDFRKQIKDAALRHSTYNMPVIALIGFTAIPSILTGTFFIPLIGFLLSLLFVSLTVYYFFLKRSFLLVIVCLASSCLSIVICSTITYFSITVGEMGLYILIASVVMLLLIQIMTMLAMIHAHFEKGSEIIRDKKNDC
jgi:hypothetical protein